MQNVNISPMIDFNSRPSARGDQRSLPHAKGSAEFQFTPLREGRRVAR